jgi:hypothetical protein
MIVDSMTEQTHSCSQSLETGQPVWDVAAIAEALGSGEHEDFCDNEYGAGSSIWVGRRNEAQSAVDFRAQVDLYPAAGVIRLLGINRLPDGAYTVGVDLTLNPVQPPRIVGNRVIFEYIDVGEEVRYFSLTSTGEVTLLVAPFVAAPDGDERRLAE